MYSSRISEGTPAMILAEAENVCVNNAFSEYAQILRPVVTATIIGMLGGENYRMVKKCRDSMPTIMLFCMLGNKQVDSYLEANHKALEDDLDSLAHLTLLSGFQKEIYSLQISLAKTLLKMSCGK